MAPPHLRMKAGSPLFAGAAATGVGAGVIEASGGVAVGVVTMAAAGAVTMVAGAIMVGAVGDPASPSVWA